MSESNAEKKNYSVYIDGKWKVASLTDRELFEASESFGR